MPAPPPQPSPTRGRASFWPPPPSWGRVGVGGQGTARSGRIKRAVCLPDEGSTKPRPPAGFNTLPLDSPPARGDNKRSTHRTGPRPFEGRAMKTATGRTVIRNGQLVDGNGGAARARRRRRRSRRAHRLCRPAAGARRGPAEADAHRRARRHDHAGPGRGPLPPDLLQRRGPGRPRHQVSRRVRHAARRGQRPAGAGVRLHRGAQRRQPVQHRRLAEEGHRERPHARARGWRPAAARSAASAG